jgi:hypothetical protein
MLLHALLGAAAAACAVKRVVALLCDPLVKMLVGSAAPNC